MRISSRCDPTIRPCGPVALSVVAALACGVDVGGGASSSLSAGQETEAGTDGASTSIGGEGASGADGSDSDGTKFDVPSADTGTAGDSAGPQSCKVSDDQDGVAPCEEQAPPDSFAPDVQWGWGDVNQQVLVTPLVANLTDDNGDAEIDLCDVPDIVVVAFSGYAVGPQASPGTLVVLDGATGEVHFTADTPVSPVVNPALGDLDADGLVEIVAGTPLLDGAFQLVAFEHDGTPKWVGPSWPAGPSGSGDAIAIADVDNDGSPEILVDTLLVNSGGETLWQAPQQQGWMVGNFDGKVSASVMADLDGDQDLEIVLGQAAYDGDGSTIWQNLALAPGYPQVANLDADDDPEILLNNHRGISILEHDGTVTVQDVRPTGDPAEALYGLPWERPSTIHDFDGDGAAEFAVSSASHYSVFEPSPMPTVHWMADIEDVSGAAAGTAFDFLGDGGAEAIYADEVNLLVYDDAGELLLSVPRSSSTLIEYPVVADVDNDGSAEIVVVSNREKGYAPWDPHQSAPSVQVIRDSQDRWVGARRIWNQHTYHVTNVREDGTIPQFEPPSSNALNTYRTQAQLEGGVTCQPEPAG